jgi:hypothetical protein
MLNAWPMGFYPPATLVHDARRHGVQGAAAVPEAWGVGLYDLDDGRRGRNTVSREPGARNGDRQSRIPAPVNNETEVGRIEVLSVRGETLSRPPPIGWRTSAAWARSPRRAAARARATARSRASGRGAARGADRRTRSSWPGRARSRRSSPAGGGRRGRRCGGRRRAAAGAGAHAAVRARGAGGRGAHLPGLPGHRHLRGWPSHGAHAGAADALGVASSRGPGAPCAAGERIVVSGWWSRGSIRPRRRARCSCCWRMSSAT